ncbi:hypothetical protein QIS99_30380 [Streptomyces sp. B-S-A8]|uniref:Uncharacterized protein n=1 Tax=Streptomyces solicavernae TaxID=3043614 RepID=A0ABT6S1A1_9ACTN|nr:hypothetical protein [Streptomyces sp. B-S-A8]MDI3390468.1 hypothetical protein [Streptomyces sp. B-S-A8]
MALSVDLEVLIADIEADDLDHVELIKKHVSDALQEQLGYACSITTVYGDPTRTDPCTTPATRWLGHRR